MLAIMRRRRHSQAMDEPDRLHLQHLVFDFLRSGPLSRWQLWQQNSHADSLILVFAAACSVTAYHSLGFTSSAVGFCIAYVFMIGVMMHILKPYSSNNLKQSKGLS